MAPGEWLRRAGRVFRRFVPLRARVTVRSLLRAGDPSGRGLATPADLRASYRLLLGRRPDRRGELDFLTLLDRGMTRDDLVRHFLSSPEFRARRLALDEGGGVPETVVVGDLVFHLDPADFAIAPHLVGGEYEPAVLAALRRHLSPGDTFVDVGASFGYFATRLGRDVGPRGSVIAFEPGPQNHSLLLLNLSANGVVSAEVHQLALSNRPGLLAYSRSGANGVVSPFGGDPRELATHDLVQASTLDRELGGRTVHALKIDAEGAEGLVLSGARALLRSSAPTIVLEFSPPALEAISKMSGGEVLRLLESHGYAIGIIESPDREPAPLHAATILERFEVTPEAHLNLLAWRAD